jgi:hypothetical protein
MVSQIFRNSLDRNNNVMNHLTQKIIASNAEKKSCSRRFFIETSSLFKKKYFSYKHFYT